MMKRPWAVGATLAALTMVIACFPWAQVEPQSAAFAAAGPSMSGLHVVGNRIENGDDVTVRLVGVNRSSPEYLCSENGGIFEGPADQSEVSAMQAWSIKAVRVVLNEDCWLGINGVSQSFGGTQYQNAVAAYVNLLTSNNIAVIINLHFSAPGGQLAKDQAPMADIDHSPAFWQSVALRFKDNSAVLFEPYNEPHPDGGNNTSDAWRCWRDGGICPGVSFIAAGMQELVTAIRATGATNIIILTGNKWGSQLDQWLQYRPIDPLNQLAAGWHSYGDGLDCQDEGCWNSTLKTVLQEVPIIATEIGELDCGHSYIDRVMKFLDQYGQSYLAWSWGPFDCAGDPALLQDWSGTPTQTYGQGFKTHLTNLAAVANPTPTPTRTPTPPDDASSALVQSSVLNASGTSGSVTYPRAVARGNLLVAAVRLGSARGTASITDNNANQWQLVDRRADTGGGNGEDLELWIAVPASALPHPQPTLTIRSSTPASLRAVVAEFRGVVPTSAALDQHAIAIGTSASPHVTTPGAAAQANELVIGYGEVENMSTFKPGDGYVMDKSVPSGSGGKVALEHKVAAAVGVQTAGFGVASQAWGMGIATFRRTNVLVR